jgi:hypothetical protein
VLLGATAFVLTPILVAQALRGQRRADAGLRAGHVGVQHRGASGSWLAGVTLSTSLGLRGPALTGLVLALASLVPLTMLAAVRPPRAASE